MKREKIDMTGAPAGTLPSVWKHTLKLFGGDPYRAAKAIQDSRRRYSSIEKPTDEVILENEPDTTLWGDEVRYEEDDA